MPTKLTVKPILEQRANGVSMRNIETVLHISRHTIKKVYDAADSVSIGQDDIKDKDEDIVYNLLFPTKDLTSTFEVVDYEYVHSELKKTGVTLKLLWNEYKNQCIAKGTIPCGYTKFCYGYSDYVQITSVTNHLTHKPGVAVEVDWSGSTMNILTHEGEKN